MSGGFVVDLSEADYAALVKALNTPGSWHLQPVQALPPKPAVHPMCAKMAEAGKESGGIGGGDDGFMARPYDIEDLQRIWFKKGWDAAVNIHLGNAPADDFWRKVIDRAQPTRSADMPVVTQKAIPQRNPYGGIDPASAPSEAARNLHNAVMQHRRD